MAVSVWYLCAICLCFCFFFGIAYPIVMMLVYPLYRLLGGDDGFREYMSNI